MGLTRDFYLPVCLFFRVILILPPLLGVETPLGLDALLGLDAPLGLDALLDATTRRNKQPPETEDTIMDSGATYLSLLVRLNTVLNLLGRFLTQSTASNPVTGL